MEEDARTKSSEAETIDGETSTPRRPEHVELAQATVVGRYVVLAKAGAGGMGVVYAAYDPDLDRKVALKLLHPRARDGVDGRTRLLREAQALARLSHPSIVAVYDVGTIDDRVWLAMEFVAGTTLREWSRDAVRSWREVLSVMTIAGRGLAAAHDAGLVHRDFKPDNVMIGQPRATGGDARRVAPTTVRVMDFGLARAAGESSHDADEGPHDGLGLPRLALSETMTRAGALAGTPVYMPAERLGGAAADASSDQFAFCVTMWEVLFGARPFAADTLVTLAAEMLGGRVHTPARNAGVPKWLRRALQRGLAADPTKRWPTMAALLRALERGQARARVRRGLAAAVTVGLVAVGVAAAYEVDRRQRTAACADDGATIAEVWNDDAAAKLREALVATGLAYADTTARKLVPWLDVQAETLQHARTEACLDGTVRKLWDADTLERSLWCLDERRMDLEALLGELAHADATVMQRAVSATTGLPRVGPCRDAAALARLPPPPIEQREQVRAVRVELSRADVLDRAGKYDEGLALVRSTSARAEALGWPPLTAAVHTREASLLERKGEFAESERIGKQAYFEAARGGAWDVAAVIASKLIFVVGYRLARHGDGLDWGVHAELALVNVPDPDGVREAGRLNNLAAVYRLTGDLEQARALHERALGLWEKALGPDHPDVALSLNNLSGLHHAMGDRAQALALLERALAIREQALGPDHPDVAQSLTNMAGVYTETGELARAIALDERALAISERALGPDHRDLATSLGNLANTYHLAGDYARAQTLNRRALAILEKALGVEHPDVAQAVDNLALAHFAAGELTEARALHDRALAIREKLHGHDHPSVARTLDHLVAVHLATGAPAAALPLAERAMATYDRLEGVQDREHQARFMLAKALVATDGDRLRARSLAEQARDGWRDDGAAKEVSEVEAWLLREHLRR